MSESTKFQDYSNEVWSVLENEIQGLLIDLPPDLVEEVSSSTLEAITISIRECILKEFQNHGIGSREALWNLIEDNGSSDDIEDNYDEPKRP